jgi:hypothetical protein
MLTPVLLLPGRDSPILIRSNVRHGDRVLFRIQVEPRGELLDVGLTLPEDFERAPEWRLPEDALGNDVAGPLVAHAVAEDPSGGSSGKVWDGISFVSRLLTREMATDEELINYVAGKVYWSWRFGLTEAAFGYADEILLGLRKERPSASPLPSDRQIERAAYWGIEEYWKERFVNCYVPTHRLLEEYPLEEKIAASLGVAVNR